MRSLCILHVTPYFADAWAYGGIPRIAGALAHGLAERGHHVTVCATDACDESARLTPRTGDGRFRPWPPRRTAAGVDVRVFPNVSNRLAYNQLFMPLGLGDYLKRSASGFDVAHLHACRNLPGAIAARHLQRAGVPYIIAPNGTALRLERWQFAKRVFDIVAGTRVLGRAARVLAVSDAERGQLRSIGVADEAIRQVANPVDLGEFGAPIPRGRFRARIGRPGPLVLFLGRITPRKRLDVLLRAFATLPGAAGVLVIAGNDAGAAHEAGRLARELGIAERTVFTGLLCGSDRLEALADADVVVYPSQEEIFGLVPLEALLSGTPVVVADDSGCAEVMRDVGGGTIVPMGSVSALARAIDDTLNRSAHWRQAAADAALRVRAKFSAATICAELDDVYQEMAAAA